MPMCRMDRRPPSSAGGALRAKQRSLLPTSDFRLPTSYLCFLLPASYLLPPTSYLLPPTSYLLLPYLPPPTSYLPPPPPTPEGWVSKPSQYHFRDHFSLTAHCLSLPTDHLSGTATRLEQRVVGGARLAVNFGPR